ncbi:MAG: LysR family transcriptional regulator [Novosphingobium sp.]
MTASLTARPPNIRHLAALAATVRHGSVTRAARAVNLTQPALTQLIARLENDLGCRLFDRGPAGMVPTEPALLLAPRVEAAIALIGSPRVTGTQTRAFLALARVGSYAGAEQSTGLSSAALHRAVADLSVALGQRLVERRGRSVMLTAQGMRRARAFGLAMAELRAGFDEVAAWQGLRAGKVVIGAMPLSRARWLPETILRFSRAHPGVAVSVVEGSYAELSGPLRDGEIDMMLGALRDPASLDDLTQEAVFTDRPAVIMRAGHPLASRKTLSGDELARFDWFMPSRETPLRGYWEDMMRQTGAEVPPVRIECGSVLTIRQLLVGSDALTMLSRSQVAVELADAMLVAIASPVPVERSIGVLSRKGWRPTASQQAFVDVLREVGMAEEFT